MRKHAEKQGQLQVAGLDPLSLPLVSLSFFRFKLQTLDSMGSPIKKQSGYPVLILKSVPITADTDTPCTDTVPRDDTRFSLEIHESHCSERATVVRDLAR